MDTHDPSEQIRAHVAAAIAKLKSISESVGPLDEEKTKRVFLVVEVELGRAIAVVDRLRNLPHGDSSTP
jgi:hypothetical protein